MTGPLPTTVYINSTVVQDMLRLPGGSGVPGKMFKEEVVSQEPWNAKVMPAYLGALSYGYFLVGSGDRYPHKSFIEMARWFPSVQPK